MRLSRKNKGIKRKLKRTKKRGGVSADRKPPKVEKSSNNKPGKKLTLDLVAAEKVRVQQNREYNDMQFLKEKQKRNEAAIKGNKNYTPPERGVEQIDQSPNEVHEGFKRMDDDEEYFRLQRKGLTFGGKTRKKKKEFLYNPNDPSKSFDVYINKNPSDTIPIKYTTVKDVRETISKLERLYKNKKYPHKRIWQVAMIMKVRLEAMKKHKKTRYPNAKNVTSRYNLANKYFKKLGKRSKELAKKRRTRKKKGGSDGDTDDENNMDEEEFGNSLDELDNRRSELKQRRSEIRRARSERSLTDAEEEELKSIETELDEIDIEMENLHKMYDYYDENPNKRRRMRGGNNKKEEILKLCADGIQMIKNIGIDNNEINIIQKMVDDNYSTIYDIIMKSINNKNDVQENLWDLILKLKSFIENNGVQSGGRENQPSKVPMVRTTSGEEPRAPHEIDPHDPVGIRQVLRWEDLTREDREDLLHIGAREDHVRNLMAVGMTLEQLRQLVRTVDNSLLSNRGIIRRGNHFHQTQTRPIIPRFPVNFKYILLAILMLLISLPRVINFFSARNHPNPGLNLILDMLQLILSLLYLVHRGGN
jgi:hypothetical protein